MTFDEYQQKAITTEVMERAAEFSANDPAFVAKILGLVGETGEVAEKFKKIVRDKGGKLSDEDKIEIRKELGDVLWYISAVSDYIGLSLNDVAKQNLEKLFDRKNRGTQRGSGDNR